MLWRRIAGLIVALAFAQPAFAASPSTVRIGRGETRSFPTVSGFTIAAVGATTSKVVVTFVTKDDRYSARTYEISPFGEQIVDLSHVTAPRPIDVTIVNRGEEDVIVTNASAADATEQQPPPQSAADSDERGSTTTLYAMPSLYLAASREAKAKLLFGFKGASFVEPATGLVYMRDRWYDATTGTFLTPDAVGFTDSSNAFIYGVGDPVNNSDPAGLEASMGRNGWIVATNNRTGRIRRFNPAEIAADPQQVRYFLGVNARVDAREADAMIKRAGASWATGSDKMRVVAPGAAKAAGIYPLMAMTAGAGLGGGVGVVVSSELAFGFLGSTMLPGFTGGLGSQGGADLEAGRFSGVRSYAVSGSVGAVNSLAFSTIFIGGQRLLGFGTPDIFPSIGDFAPPSRTFSGGAYRDLSTAGVQRHHMPADSVSPLPTRRGPAIEMLPRDHLQTASWGRSRAAMTYRARQQALMNEGRFVEAIQMDINDARVLFGDRYATAIEEMLRYTSTVDPATYTPGGRVAVRK